MLIVNINIDCDSEHNLNLFSELSNGANHVNGAKSLEMCGTVHSMVRGV